MQIYLTRRDITALVRTALNIPEYLEVNVQIDEDIDGLAAGVGNNSNQLQETKSSTNETEAPKRRGRPPKVTLDQITKVEKTEPETPQEAPESLEEAVEERMVVADPEKLAEAVEAVEQAQDEAAAEENKVEPVEETSGTPSPRKSLFGNLTRVVNEEPAQAPKEEAPLTPASAEDGVLEPSEDEIAEEFGTNDGDGSIVEEIQKAETSGGTDTAASEETPVADEAPKPRPSLFANLKK